MSTPITPGRHPPPDYGCPPHAGRECQEVPPMAVDPALTTLRTPGGRVESNPRRGREDVANSGTSILKNHPLSMVSVRASIVVLTSSHLAPVGLRVSISPLSASKVSVPWTRPLRSCATDGTACWGEAIQAGGQWILSCLNRGCSPGCVERNETGGTPTPITGLACTCQGVTQTCCHLIMRDTNGMTTFTGSGACKATHSSCPSGNTCSVVLDSVPPKLVVQAVCITVE